MSLDYIRLGFPLENNHAIWPDVLVSGSVRDQSG